MADTIQNLLHDVLGEGARSAKFECQINFNSPLLFAGKEEDIKMYVKTSQFPGISHDTIDIKYKGRTIPLKGQTKYDQTWSCTFYLTENHDLKTAFESWINSIDQKHNYYTNSDIEDAQEDNDYFGYTVDLLINQFDYTDKEIASTYTLHNAFPKSVSTVDVDYSSVGSILEFTVEFSFSHFTVQTFKNFKSVSIF